MASVKGLGHGLLEAVAPPPPSQESELDTTNDGYGNDSDTSLEALVSEVESCKNRGNVEFYKGKALAKHTAGKNLLRDACILYAEGLQALAKADAHLLAKRPPGNRRGQHDHQQPPPQQQQQQQDPQKPEKDQDLHASGPKSSGTGEDNTAKAAPTPTPTSEKERPEMEEDRATASSGRNLTPAELAALARRADAVRPSLYLNLAACNLLLQEWAPAIACCTRVLEGFCAAEVETEETVETETDDAAVEVSASGRTRSSEGGRSTTATATEEGDTLRPGGERHQEQARQGLHGEAQRDSSGGRLAGDGPAAGGGGGVDSSKQATEEGERETERSRRRDMAAKCLYRRAAARKGGGDLRAAREDLVGALRLRPRDAAIGRELKSVEKKLADEEARESLRRQTEEGRRRRRQQQKQKQRNSNSGDSAGDAAATTPAAAPSAAPRADNATIAGGASAGKGPGVGSSANSGKTGCTADGSVGKQTGRRATQAGGERARGQQQEAPRWGDEKGERSGAEEEEEGESHSRSEQQSGDEAFPTWNGAECRDGLYAWNQSIREVQVCVRVPGWARARDVRVDIRRLRVSVAVVDVRTCENNGVVDDVGGGETDGPPRGAPAGRKTVLLEGALSRPVQVDECLWTMERAGRVLLHLHKELPADCEPGFEWWASVLEGDPEVDVLTCDAGSDASKYPEHAKRRGARALWEHQNKSPEQKLKEERMHNARRQMEEEAEERQRDLQNAMKDPKKAELYRQLRETMPETSISIK